MPDEATVRRVLLASLHQAIAEVLPSRLDFYDPWLIPSTQELSVESFMTMLSFLQQEAEAFDLISSRAGHYAAVRSFQELSPLKRAGLRILPRGTRARKAVGLLTRILPSLYPEARIDATRRRGTFFVGIEGSPFCALRGSHEPATCSFYSSSIATFLQLFNLRPSVRVRGCQSMGMRSCLLMVLPDQARGAIAEGGVLGLADDVMIPPSLESGGPAMELPAIKPQGENREAGNVIADEASTSVEAPITETGLVSEATPVPETSPVPEAATVPEAGPNSETRAFETRPIPGTRPIVEVVPATEPALIPDVAPDVAVAPVADAPTSAATLTGVAESPAAAPNVAMLWDRILAKRTRPPRPVRLNLDALFAQPAKGVDGEAPWHRLDES